MGVPERQCIGCGRRAPQAELVRLTMTVQQGVHTVEAVAEGGHGGRGAYLCKRQACLERALARRAFQRAFRQSVEVDREPLEREISGARSG